ncbi:MAG: hypothetical protein NTY67_14640 [Cyanobacteria bacterium]|nr:hypothetical protein [Cyanobacteriota bacterium]
MAMLNWHPVVEYEIREIEREKWLQQLRSETEQLRNENVQLQNEELQREIAHEQRMQQIASETEQLRKENAREAELNAKIAALWPSSTSNSAQAPPPERDSPT